MAGAEELRQLAADLNAVAGQSPRKARQVVQQAGKKAKDFWRETSRNPLGKQYTASIDYEIEGSTRDGEIVLEVGPNLTRYGGKTGRGGLTPSFGIFDDPLRSGGLTTPPDRARRRAEKFTADDVERGITIALDQLLKAHDL